jgi:hypothetical protein
MENFFAKLTKDPTVILTLLFGVVLVGFAFAYISLTPIKIVEMQSGEFFIEKVTPLAYWIGVAAIAVATFLTIRFLKNDRARLLFLLSSILLLISVRMVFPLIFLDVPSFEPDAAIYINVVNSWMSTGVNFGIEGNYQHDYPLSFILAYVFTKIGVPVETFFRFAPFFIYAINLILVYLLISKVSSDRINGAAAAFLLSISSLGYWITVHYSPDLVGTMLYFLSFYLVYRFVKKGEANIKSLLPVLVSIMMLILSHHLSTLYFIVTLFGLAFSTWFLKSPLKTKYLWFLLLPVFSYTLWFVYGSFVYPSFFHFYAYIHGFTSPSSLAIQASFLDNVSFWIYPLFVIGLFLLDFSKLFEIEHVSDIVSLPKRFWKLRSSQTEVPETLSYSFGFIFIAFLFAGGFILPASFPLRVLEVLLIGVYPFSSQSFVKFASGNSSKKRTVLMLILFLIITIMDIHRYYRQIQRRVLISV